MPHAKNVKYIKKKIQKENFQADVYKQKVTDKNPNTMLHYVTWFTDEPIGTTAKSPSGKLPEIKRCKQAA